MAPTNQSAGRTIKLGEVQNNLSIVIASDILFITPRQKQNETSEDRTVIDLSIKNGFNRLDRRRPCILDKDNICFNWN